MTHYYSVDVGPGNGDRLAAATSFFDSVRRQILNEGMRRGQSGARERYETIAAEFNRLLSARFPFSQSQDGAPEVSLEGAAAFLRVYQAQGGRSLREPLEALKCSADALTFIRQMDSAWA